ncbi:MAG: YHS domain-containing (seleno)protein [Marinobacter sp.]|uniref:YHS domain-containing (seleno)protein n=1 Tax=Marinobacter sp. TaxID=50741 RepID=UPI00299DD526|nr:YHS domain-containing (seleno)protein [Marinobacter sp.]MDX1756028.1 YHS domain-containing (seleno)protein [Marinobacter sp.]
MGKILLLAATLLAATVAWADKSPVYTGLLSNTGAGGYDVVAYFEQRQAVPGSSDFTVEYQGATWRFSSAEHQARFAANPEHFAPAYGGYCAWAVSQGYLAKGDPEYWTIVDDRLYLNFSQDIQDRWLKDTEGFIQQADRHWPGVLE